MSLSHESGDEGPGLGGPYGLQFHRWMPAGCADAIDLPTEEPDIHISVWFERRGYVDDGLIKYYWNRTEVDPALIPRQHRIDGGNLFGRVVIGDVPEDAYAAVRENRLGDPLYVRLGKRLVRVLCPAVSNFISILRTHYGQYWLPELPPWDSRRSTLGLYCPGQLGLHWSLDGGETWTRFQPDEAAIGRVVMVGPMPGYVSREDWEELRGLAASGFTPTPAADVLGRAHGHADSEEWRYALVEGVTALDLALSDFTARRLKGDDELLRRLAAFNGLNLPTKLVAATAFLGAVSQTDLAATLDAPSIIATTSRTAVGHQTSG